MKTPPHHEAYVPAPERDEKLQFCVKALENILSIPGGADVKEELFRAVVWIVAEIDGKFTTRYRSRDAREAPAGSVQHEHVFPMRDLWAIAQGHMSPAQLLPLVTACVVTRDEHRKLSAYDRLPSAQFGWMRYTECKIQVVDMLEYRDLNMDDFKKLNAALAEAIRVVRRAAAKLAPLVED